MSGQNFSDVTSLASGARALNLQYEAEIRDAYIHTAGLKDADVLGLAALANALDALADAKTTAAGILTDPRYSDSHKTDQARALVSQAISAAQDAGRAYSGLLDSTRALLASSMLAKQPKSADSSIVAFRAQEIVKLLEGAGTGAATAANDLLADALATDDSVAAHILAGGTLLNATYQRLGVDMALLGKLFAKTLARSQGDSSGNIAAGAGLLALLSQGGSGTFYGFRDWVTMTLAGELQQFNTSLAAFVAIGGVQGVNLGPVQQRQVPQSVAAWPAGSGRPDPRQQMLRAEAMRELRRQD